MRPEERPTKRRSAVRVLVVAGGEVLLQQDSDPGVPNVRWWVTPGGGIDPGEGPRQAAVRELWEETGLRVEPEAIVGPVATREVRHGYSDRVLMQHETFFRVDVGRFTPAPGGLTETERARLCGHGWFAFDALPEVVWPACLARLLQWDHGPAINLGRMDESTVD